MLYLRHWSGKKFSFVSRSLLALMDTFLGDFLLLFFWGEGVVAAF